MAITVRTLLVAALLALGAPAWAAAPYGPNRAGETLKKSNSLAVKNSPETNTWTALCDMSVGGVDAGQSYSGVVLFQWYRPESVGPATTVFDALFQVDPAHRTWTASAGIYKVTAKLIDRRVTIHAEVNFATLNDEDMIFCDSRIDRDEASGGIVTLFEAHMRAVVFP